MKEPKLKLIEEGLNLILEVLVDGYDPLYFKVNGEVELINTNHMKELNIEAPEGYEIDNEKSDLSKGIVRFKRVDKKLDYKEICTLLGLNKSQFFIETDEILDVSAHFITKYTGNEAKSKKQLEALLALNKLKNVANYLNNGWKPAWSGYNYKYYIHVTQDNSELRIDSGLRNYGRIVFRTPELAWEAIEILGKDVIRLALSFGSV